MSVMCVVYQDETNIGHIRHKGSANEFVTTNIIYLLTQITI